MKLWIVKVAGRDATLDCLESAVVWADTEAQAVNAILDASPRLGADPLPRGWAGRAVAIEAPKSGVVHTHVVYGST